jgi:ABC-type lipoprotein export system ATPase subunit
VLEVDHLSIPSGKLIVILGLSGAGKSTFLETLGLMNNTMLPGSSIRFTPNEKESFDYNDLWSGKIKGGIYEVRRLYFSFIFQNTNLMPNFTVFENISLTQMLQGKSQEQAMEDAEVFMKQLGLQEIDKEKKSYELSGGQAQRVAFVRAITPDFTILFGDEPTGNLDEKNSWDLMGMIKEKITGWGKTAIIVTHNLNLALEFADQIILITKPNSHGVIEPDNVFDKIETEGVWTNNKSKLDNELMNDYLKTSLGL